MKAMTNLHSTYNHYYSDTVQKRRHDKFKAMTAKAQGAATIRVAIPAIGRGPATTQLNEDTFQREMVKAVERDMETFAAEEALESEAAIYKLHLFSLSFNISHN